MVVQSLFDTYEKDTVKLLKRAARHIIHRKGSCSADDLREEVGRAGVPAWKTLKIYGAVFRDGKMFKRIGDTPSRVPTSHGRRIGVFVIHPNWKSDDL